MILKLGVLAGVLATTAVIGNAAQDSRRHPSSRPSTTARVAPSICHYRHRAGAVYQDGRCTPGELNPAAVADPQHTICVPGYTKTIRPPVSLTDRWKIAIMKRYGVTGSPHDYELDHLVALEDGGAPGSGSDWKNLWPEPGATPNPKDSVENQLHAQICAGRMTVRQAAHILETNWSSQ